LGDTGFQHVTIKPLAGLRILILEDEFLIAMDIEHLCRDHGASECVIARRVEEADDISSFDIAIVDMKLGTSSTLEHAHHLRSHGIPFIFATGYSELDGADGDFADIRIVQKPYEGPDLIEALVATLQNQSSLVGDG